MASRRSRVSESMSEPEPQPRRDHHRLQIEPHLLIGRAALRAIVEVLAVDDDGEGAHVEGDAGVGDPAALALDRDGADAERLEVAAGEIARVHIRGAGADVRIDALAARREV